MAARDLIPVIGAGGGGGKGGGSGSTSGAIESPDSLRSTQYARVINVICEGEVEGIVGDGRGIYLDDTPLVNADGSWNFSGAAIEWRSGTALQAPITGFSATESESSVGIAVTAAVPVTRSVTNPNATALRVTLGFAQITEQNTTNGNITGSTVQLAIDIQKNGGGFQQIYVDTVTGKTTSRYQRSYRIELVSRFGEAGGTFDTRVRRLTPDSTVVAVQNSFQWETMTEIVDSMLMYPYSALVGVQIDASTFRSIPKLAFDMKLRRVQVPSNYDPLTRAYNGIWDGTFKVVWTDNPAWILYDLATTARFGLGAFVTPDLIDKWTLYGIAQYCDGMVPDGFGGYEPRYTCNVYIQERAEAIALLQQFASIFNGLIFWSGGTLTFSADMPADVSAVYTKAGVIDGVFSYVGTPLNQRHTTALITWNDPANTYQQAIEYVEDREGIDQWGIRPLALTAFGCTSRGMAHRIGKWALLTERLLSETVTFATGINAAFSRPGDVFATTDETRAGLRMGGRILGGDASHVLLDAPAQLVGGAGYTLSVVLPSGRFETRTVTSNMSGPNEALTVSPPFSEVPARMAVWSLSSTALVNEQWRCIGVTENDDGNVQLSGIAYRPDKFAAVEYNLTLEPLPVSIIDPFHIGTPTELHVTESKYEISPVIVGARATFSWLAPLGAVRFDVAWQYGQDSAVYATAFMNSIDIEPTREGSWTFTVWAINAIGMRSGPASVTVQLRALNQPPEDVKGAQLDIFNDAANLVWLVATDLDVIVGGQLVVRFSSRMSTLVVWEEANEIARFAGSQSSGLVALMKGTYLLKFVNSSGAYSDNPAYVVSTTGPLRDYNLIEDLRQDPAFAGQRVNMEVRNGVLFLSQGEDRHAVALQGGYYFDRTVDLGKVYTVHCGAYVDGARYDLFDDVDQWPDWDLRADVDGTKINEGGALVLASLTNVDPAKAAAADWSPYQRLIVADLTFRAVRFALSVVVPQDIYGMGIIDLGATVDVPDRIESRNNIPVSAGGTVVTFSVPFKDAPAISIIAQGLQTGDKWLIDQQSAYSFRIQFQNSVGAGIAKTCDWIARGYGYEHVDLNALGYHALMRGDVDAFLAARARTGLVIGEPA
ncbi:TipJ family phage tail tip protein [Paraburkholderia dipogonis]|uniref:host specificity protein J n=1 Tax=Paraburkholderia dipogonis TaxID=1211383 RepID=UPI0038BCB62E